MFREGAQSELPKYERETADPQVALRLGATLTSLQHLLPELSYEGEDTDVDITLSEDRAEELAVDIAAYVPLEENKGSFALFNNEAFLGYRLNDRLKLGVATGFFGVEGESTQVRFGPAVKWQVGRGKFLALRYLFGRGGNDRVRVQLTQVF